MAADTDTSTTTSVTPLPMSLVLWVVNKYGQVPRAAAHESNDPYPDPTGGGAPESALRRLLGPLDLAELITTADAVHPVFAATSGAACADHLNRLTRAAGLAPSWVADGRHVHQSWVGHRSQQRLLAASAVALLDHLLSDPDAARLGTCQGADCADAYVDQSPAGCRQYCSLTCQNRARTRAYRAHRRAEQRS